MSDTEVDYREMGWQDLLQEIWDRVYEGPPEALREEVSRRFRDQDARGKQYMLQDVGSSLWHIYGMTDRENDCGT